MLTVKQNQLLLYIHKKVSESGVSPSFDEMKDALGLKSKSGVHRLIKALEERGFLKRMPNRARALEVVRLPEIIPSNTSNVVKGAFGAEPRVAAVNQTPPANDSVDVPLHGKIAAGTPIEALENADSFISIPASMMGMNDCYALEVSGDSMIELGILDGDTVLIESTNTARDGDVIVALVDNEEATLKTLRRQGSHIALMPANRDFDTQIFEADRVQVQGKLIGLVRTYH